MRRGWLAAFASGVLVVLLCGTEMAAAQAPLPVRIGRIPGLVTLPVDHAAQAGYFKAEGLDVTFVHFGSGADGARGLVAGAADIGTMDLATVLQFIERGQRFRVLANNRRGPTIALLLRSDLNIRKGDVAALKGLRIGVSSAGSFTDQYLRLLLTEAGLSPDRDVTILPIGNFTNQLAALRNRQIDAQMSWAPGITILEQANAAQLFLDPRVGEGPQRLTKMVGLVVAGPEKYIAENREVVRRVTRALVKASRDLQNTATFVEAAKAQNPNLDPGVVRAMAPAEAVGYSPELTAEHVAAVNEAYRAAGLLKTEIPYDAVIDRELAGLWK